MASVAQTMRGPGGRQCRRRVLAVTLDPFGVADAEEFHQPRIVDAQDRPVIEGGRCEHRAQLARFDLRADALCAHRNFDGRQKLAVFELRQRVVAQMGGGIEGLHIGICSIIAPNTMTPAASQRRNVICSPRKLIASAVPNSTLVSRSAASWAVAPKR